MVAPRRADIDAAKGLAILLVVFGHLVARADPAGVGWYEPLRRAVYAFHMPFFLYLSGMVAALTGALFTPPAAWPALCRNRAARLLIPFFGLGLLVVLGKLAAARLIFVDNQPAGLAAGIASLVWHTQASPALSIWYLFVLFTLSIVAPALLRGRPARLPLLWLAGAGLYLLPLPPLLYLDHIGRYAIFFVIGAAAGAAGPRWTGWIDRHWPRLLLLLAILLAAIAGFGAGWPPAITLALAGPLAMAALHGWLRRRPPSRLLLYFGRYSLVIYLLNTICIGLAKGLLLRLTSWNAPHFAAFAAALMLAGTFGPIAVKRYLFCYVSWLDRLTS